MEVIIEGNTEYNLVITNKPNTEEICYQLSSIDQNIAKKFVQKTTNSSNISVFTTITSQKKGLPKIAGSPRYAIQQAVIYGIEDEETDMDILYIQPKKITL